MLRAGLVDQAEAIYRGILANTPRHTTALERLGELLCQTFKRNEGLELLRQCAVELEKTGTPPSDRVRLALRLVQWRDLDGAERCAQAAIKADPGFARAYYALALVHERRHEIESAIAAAQQALSLSPSDDPVQLLMARLEARQGNLLAASSRLEVLIDGNGSDLRVTRRARRELGLILDRQGHFERAFQLIEEAGMDDLSEAHKRGITPETALRRIEHYRATYLTHPDPVLLPQLPANSRAPAFLMGFVRSGTTLLEQVLAAHPQIVSCDEEPIVYGLRCEVERLLPGEGDAASKLATASTEQILRLRQFYWDRVSVRLGRLADGLIFVDKNALNTLEIGLINAVFPDAKLILALRDPRDVCLSAFMQPYMLSDMTVHFLSWQGTVDFYAALLGLWLSLREQLSLNYLEVRYEDMVDDLESQARRVLDLLGADWRPEVLAFHDKARQRIISTPSFADVTQPLHRRSLARWRNYAAPMRRMAGILASFIQAFGYDQE